MRDRRMTAASAVAAVIASSSSTYSPRTDESDNLRTDTSTDSRAELWQAE